MKYKKSVFRNLAMVTQLGISVLAPIFLCIFIGYQVDSRYGMKTLVPLLILGVLAGAKSAWHLAMRTLMQECREDEAILQEREPEGTNRKQQAEAAEPDSAESAIESGGSEEAKEQVICALEWIFRHDLRLGGQAKKGRQAANREACRNGMAEQVNEETSF